MITDTLHVVHSRAAGVDVHKHQLTATVRLATGAGEPMCETQTFRALGPGLDALAEWLTSHAVTAAAMEGTGVYWRAPLDRLEAAGIEVQLLHAHHVKQLRGRKTDVEDSRWLARVCQFGLCRPSLVPNQEFHGLRRMSRYRRQLVQKRSQTRNRIQKEIDDAGVRIGGILSDVFGKNGRIILEGLARGEDRETILSRLTPHVAEKIKLLGEALTLKLSCSGRMILNHLMTDERAEQARIAAVEAFGHRPQAVRVSAVRFPADPPPDPARDRPDRRRRDPRRDRRSRRHAVRVRRGVYGLGRTGTRQSRERRQTPESHHAQGLPLPAHPAGGGRPRSRTYQELSIRQLPEGVDRTPWL